MLYVKVNVNVTLWSDPLKICGAETSDGGGGTETPFTRHCTINMIQKVLFHGKKNIHNAALKQPAVSDSKS